MSKLGYARQECCGSAGESDAVPTLHSVQQERTGHLGSAQGLDSVSQLIQPGLELLTVSGVYETRGSWAMLVHGPVGETLAGLDPERRCTFPSLQKLHFKSTAAKWSRVNQPAPSIRRFVTSPRLFRSHLQGILERATASDFLCCAVSGAPKGSAVHSGS